MYFNYWGDTNYLMKAIFLTLWLVILLFLTFIIIFSALKKLKQESENKLSIPENKKWKELFEYLTKNLNIKNTFILSQYLNQDYNEVKKLIDEQNYDILNQLIIQKYEEK